MSRMIRINDGCYVAADLIAEIKMNSSSSTITVRMKDGIGHCHSPGYKQTVYAALDALIAEVNSALSTSSSAGGEVMTNEETPLMRRYREEVERRHAGVQQAVGICPACGDLLVKSLHGTKHSRASNTCPGLVRI